ncbi:hypothetical protein [Aquiflexum gelatinilyticum]|jgi:hypothetical protein|uniref:hypothetical protein n=1 Tax=Aquiflexum gelatinilyticum TaxID=2961943 RepID=UPI002166C3C8|nr:hypothetical protein [Aquiflexum gelatinilyticum]MCS4435913.1 hypothetical protein [Aquiflexum gelatinilyticum]
MRIFSKLALISILFITFSCNLIEKDDKNFSLQDLHGIWELSRYQQESQLFYVDTYEFKEDGTFENRSTARQQDNNMDLGYNSITNGTYRLLGNVLTLTGDQFLTLPEGSTVWYTAPDNLVGSDWNIEREYTIALKERKSQLQLEYKCAPNELCSTSPITYFRK